MQPFTAQEPYSAANSDFPPLPDPSFRLERSVEANFDVIRSLPLFSNLPPFVLYDLLRSAHVVTHNKDIILWTYGEEVSHFSIILDGWIKLFKSSADGKEAILQVLGKKDYLLDAGIGRPTLCTANVQVVETAKVLSIPLGSLREHFMRSSALAENLLAMTAQRSHNVLSHLEQTTLYDATARVGRFFLKLLLNTEPRRLDFVLPFEKSLIAAYLNIRAETFSRILKRMQTDGFQIDGQKITLPHPRALCAYCDPGLAISCAEAEPQCLATEKPAVKGKR